METNAQSVQSVQDKPTLPPRDSVEDKPALPPRDSVEDKPALPPRDSAEDKPVDFKDLEHLKAVAAASYHANMSSTAAFRKENRRKKLRNCLQKSLRVLRVLRFFFG